MESGTGARWLTTKEAATLLRVHPKHVYRLLKRGLPASRVGGQWRFLASELRAWSRDGRAGEGHKAPQLATSTPSSLIVASDEPAVEQLLTLLHGGPLFGRVQRIGGMELVVDGSALACVVAGDPPEPPNALLARVHVAHVELGLASLPGSAAANLSDLRRRSTRLASWPLESYMRSALENVLVREGIAPRLAHAKSLEVSSHADAVAAVFSGRADLAWTCAAWASRFGMPFTPLASRSLALVVRADALGDPRFVRCWEVLQSDAYKQAVSALAGHDPQRAGEIRYLPRASEDQPVRASASSPSEPRSVRDRSEVRCALVTRGHGEDASEVLLRIVRAVHKRGIAVCGCVQVPVRSRGSLAGYDLVRVGRAGSLPLARRESSHKEGFRPFVFNDETFRAARTWVEHDAADARIAVIDSLGTLESRGAGHYEAFAAAVRSSAGPFVLGSARRESLPLILHRLGLPRSAGLVLQLPCSAQAEKRFVDALVRRAGGTRGEFKSAESTASRTSTP